MDDLMDMIAAGDSSSDVSDQIKNILYAKSVQKVDEFRPYVAALLFGEEGDEE